MAKAVRSGDRLYDVSGMEHVLTARLSGDTGFGEIWRTQEPRVLVKIFKPDAGVVSADLIARLRLLPLDRLSVVRPVSPLRDSWNGYVMRGVFGGETWLDFESAIGSVPTDTWVQAQVRLAEVLATLHARSLVFGDLNPRNVLIAPDGSDVFLIDLDTVVREGCQFEMPYLAARWRSLFPPGFDGNHAYAFEDSWMLAKVVDDAWTAYARPPIDDVLPKASLELERLQRASGRKDPRLPTAAQLWRSLSQDADSLLRCTVCGVVTQNDCCPTCGRYLSHAIVAIGGSRVTLRCTSGTWRTVRRRHVQPGPGLTSDRQVCRLLAGRDGVRVDLDGHMTREPFGSARSIETAAGPVLIRADRLADE